MLKSCWVITYRYTKNLVDAEVNVRGEHGSLGDTTARAVLSNEQYTDGFELTLKMADSEEEVARFLSIEDISKMVFGPNPSKMLSREEAERFCALLTMRTQPMTIAAFDSSVPLDDVQRRSGITDDTLVDNEPGFSFLPKG